VIDALQKDPRCIEDYVARETTVARFRVVAEQGDEGPPSVRVEPFQLVRASLLSCLRTQVPTFPGLTRTAPTSAIVELIIPVSLDEVDPGHADGAHGLAEVTAHARASSAHVRAQPPDATTT
jgi:hypothetical protein